jgi:hypothetical protein
MQIAEKAVESLPGVIEKAAQSPLGILALMIVLIGLLGYTFFAKAKMRLRMAMFVLILGGVVAFGIAVARRLGPATAAQSSTAHPEAQAPAQPPPHHTQPEKIEQTTKGDMSPAVVGGNVTIIRNPDVPKEKKP